MWGVQLATCEPCLYAGSMSARVWMFAISRRGRELQGWITESCGILVCFQPAVRKLCEAHYDKTNSPNSFPFKEKRKKSRLRVEAKRNKVYFYNYKFVLR